MATKVFISFRFSDGKEIKDELVDLFDESTEVINRSEDVDRSQMSEDTIQEYLYEKLKDTSVTIGLEIMMIGFMMSLDTPWKIERTTEQMA